MNSAYSVEFCVETMVSLLQTSQPSLVEGFDDVEHRLGVAQPRACYAL